MYNYYIYSIVITIVIYIYIYIPYSIYIIYIVVFVYIYIYIYGKLITNCHAKPTDRHQSLHFTSSHANHTKRSIVYNKAPGESRICSREFDLRKNIPDMKTWFLRKGYYKNVVKSEMKKVTFMHITTNVKIKH